MFRTHVVDTFREVDARNVHDRAHRAGSTANLLRLERRSDREACDASSTLFDLADPCRFL